VNPIEYVAPVRKEGQNIMQRKTYSEYMSQRPQMHVLIKQSSTQMCTA